MKIMSILEHDPDVYGSRLRLTLEVDYDLHGEPLGDMSKRLHHMMGVAVGEGMLTGDSAAEVVQHGFQVDEVCACGKCEWDENGNCECQVEEPSDSWKDTLRDGDEVWWDDPDEGKCSGHYHIVEVKGENDVLVLRNKEGSEVEAFKHEVR